MPELVFLRRGDEVLRFSLDGSRAVYASGHGNQEDAASLGTRVGAQLLADGAAAILEDAQQALPARAGDGSAPGPRPALLLR